MYIFKQKTRITVKVLILKMKSSFRFLNNFVLEMAQKNRRRRRRQSIKCVYVSPVFCIYTSRLDDELYLHMRFTNSIGMEIAFFFLIFFFVY